MSSLEKYKDIIDLEHPEPKNHKRMDKLTRAAMFSPFAALTGYHEQVEETGRLTDQKIDLTDEAKETISMKLNEVEKNLKEEKEITITYFVKDLKKQGGKYISKTGIIRKIDLYNNNIIFKDKTKINIENIIDINIDNIKIEY